MRDLGGEANDAVTAERSRIASEGWGAQLLDRQRPDGKWSDGTSDPQWASTLHTLLLLRVMGLDPGSARTRAMVRVVRDRVTWGPEFGDSPFFEGEVEPCINGGTLALGSYFGESSDRLVDRLLGEQLKDGGWNCEAERGSVRSSFHTTICVLEGLLEYEKANGANAAVTTARGRAHEYLLGTSHVPEAINRKGDRSQLDEVLLSDDMALRRAEGPGLPARRRRRAR